MFVPAFTIEAVKWIHQRLLPESDDNMTSKLPPNPLLPKTATPGKPALFAPRPYVPQTGINRTPRLGTGMAPLPKPLSPSVQSKPSSFSPRPFMPFNNAGGGNFHVGAERQMRLANQAGQLSQQRPNPVKPALQMKGGPINAGGLPPQVFRPAGSSNAVLPGRVQLHTSVSSAAQPVQPMIAASNSVQLKCSLGHADCPAGPCRRGALNQRGQVVHHKKNKKTSHHQHKRPRKGAAKHRRS